MLITHLAMWDHLLRCAPLPGPLRSWGAILLNTVEATLETDSRRKYHVAPAVNDTRGSAWVENMLATL